MTEQIMADIPSGHSDLELLRALILGEAEAESLTGKIAVAQVVMNRMADKRWPDKMRDVILQPYQFSCFLKAYFRPSILKHKWQDVYWKEAHLAAYGVFNRYVRDVTMGANHYLASWLKEKPKWAQGQTPVAEIGQHVFYKL